MLKFSLILEAVKSPAVPIQNNEFIQMISENPMFHNRHHKIPSLPPILSS